MIEISELTIADRTGRRVVDRVSLTVPAGQRLAVVGESGSGKTTLALALLAFVRPGLAVVGGSITVDGLDIRSLRAAAVRRLRGQVVSYLAQDPASALTPTLRVRRQVTELATGDRSPDRVASRLIDMGLPGDRRFQRRYPHQLSGGQQQRLALARTCAADPNVLILDEPTTGLDAMSQDAVLDQLDRLVRDRAMTLLFITHDLPAAARMADQLVVMHAGAVVEQGPLPAVVRRPATRHTRELLAAVPRLQATGAPATVAPAGGSPSPSPLLSVRDLRADYREGRRRVPVVSGVCFDLYAGECLALLGRSGSGKTTIARCVSGLHRPANGTVLLDGEPVAPDIRDRPAAQRRRIQVVPQDSAGSLNPRRSVGAAIARPLLLRGFTRAAAVEETRRLLGLVGLTWSLADRRPGQLSGGQRQRVTIARALAADPDILLCDEMTSNLDVRVQAGVLDLVDELRVQLGLAVLLITHDLGVMARLADQVLVLRDGEIRARGRTSEVLGSPQDDWTRTLVAAAHRAAGGLALADHGVDPPDDPVTDIEEENRDDSVTVPAIDR